MAEYDITPRLIILIACGGHKKKGALGNAVKAEAELTSYMQRNKKTIEVDAKRSLIFKSE